VSKWVKVDASRRNEGLDTMNYAEAGARRKQWATLSAEDWALLDQERGAEPKDAEPELFDRMATKVEPIEQPKAEPARVRDEESAPNPVGDDWLGGRGSKWQL
jgi:phage terminase large subunit GpA-like protein